MKAFIYSWLLLTALLPRPLAAQESGQTTLTLTNEVKVYSVRAPHVLRGYFPPDTRLEVMEKRDDGFVRVHYIKFEGGVVEAFCKTEELFPNEKKEEVLEPAAPPPRGRPIRIGRNQVYKPRKWLEDAAGYKTALKLQKQLKQPILVYFYADWNDACETLEDELFDSFDFKREAKKVIKVKVNPEHGKKEGKLANDLKIKGYPYTLVLSEPGAKPRRIQLIRWSFGSRKVQKIERAMMDIHGTAPPPVKKMKAKPAEAKKE